MTRIIAPEQIEYDGDWLGSSIGGLFIHSVVGAVLLCTSLLGLKTNIEAPRISVKHPDFHPSHDSSLWLLEWMGALSITSPLKPQWLEFSRCLQVAGRYVLDFTKLVHIWFTGFHNRRSASSICTGWWLLFLAIQEIRQRDCSLAPELPRDGGFRERFGDRGNRNRSVFGVDWFFEWPQGRRPLNSTWPWAGVKPSLLVLWGVCWMFYMRVGYSQEHTSQGPRLNQRFVVQTPIHGYPFAVAQRPRNHKGHHDAGDLPIKQEPSEGPTMVYQEHEEEPALVRQAKQAVALGGRYQATAPQGIRHTGGIAHPAAPGSQGSGVYSYYHDPSAYANAAGTYLVQSAQTTVPEAGVAEWRALGEQAAQTLRGPPYQVPPPHHHNQNSPQPYYGRAHLVPSHYPVSSTRFYPNPAADMSLSYESRTFMPDANYPDMQMNHPQDQEDFKHDQPRYPSPPPPLSENPYNPQAIGAPPDDRLEIPELPKDESEAAASPGRSKPVPKPDREVTRYDNGRFYCNWPNCTEEVREFNRKCEWRCVSDTPS
ncbi:hypothetical protein F5884DRAFT_286627 [Xylogone sp. PMI_703]|nr:hypothetical protein F5884DRAFT_286627 [Xylogone sp. PMI_703]